MEEKNEQEHYDNFEDMGLRENVLRGIFAYGFEKPSAIQAKGIVPMFTGTDIIAQAQSGSGKTGTFVISILQKINEKHNGPQAIIAVPTRELAMQIADVAKNIGTHTKIKPVLCIGGTDIQSAKRQLQKGPSIVIGTPGRIIDMIERKFIRVKFVKILVLDEADEMLSHSFISQIKNIVEYIPVEAQICLFSATMPQQVVDITNNFMKNPQTILVKNEDLTLDGIRQFYINVEQEKWKFDTFCDLYNIISLNQTIVYVNFKRKADWLKNELEKKHFAVSVIHSKMKPMERLKIMKEFRSGNTRILISTDLLSRGIDIQQVSMVVNYDVPSMNNKESYIHRIGRSGRFGRKGVAINFVTNDDFYKVKELNKFYHTEIEEMPINIAEYI